MLGAAYNRKNGDLHVKTELTQDVMVNEWRSTTGFFVKWFKIASLARKTMDSTINLNVLSLVKILNMKLGHEFEGSLQGERQRFAKRGNTWTVQCPVAIKNFFATY